MYYIYDYDTQRIAMEGLDLETLRRSLKRRKHKCQLFQKYSNYPLETNF